MKPRVSCAMMHKENGKGSAPCRDCPDRKNCHKKGTKHTFIIQAAIREDYESLMAHAWSDVREIAKKYLYEEGYLIDEEAPYFDGGV